MPLREHHLKASLETAAIVLVSALALPTSADPDLWGHLRFGLDIVAARALPTADVYAFTSDRPWINHEWLSEVLMAVSYSAAGTSGLLTLKLALLAIFLAATWFALRFAGATPLWRFVGVVFSLVATLALFHSIRPQLWSLVCCSTLLALLLAHSRRCLIAAPLLFVVWVNSHGGWVIGLLILVVFLMADVAEGRVAIRTTIWTILACSCATLVNPYGYKLLAFIGETVRTNREDITEWDPVLASKPYLTIWILCTVVLAGTAARRLSIRIIAPLTLAYLSWKVQRVTPFFTLVTIAAAIATLTRTRRPPTVDRRFVGSDRVVAGGLAALVLSVSAFVWGAVAKRELQCIVVPPDGPDVVAAAEIGRLGLHGRMVTWFDWGEYAIWHFGPTLQVSMDGRRETVYTPDTIQQYRTFLMSGFKGWPALEMMTDYVWLPRRLPAANFMTPRGWKPIISTPSSVVWARTGDLSAVGASSAEQREHCFPG